MVCQVILLYLWSFRKYETSDGLNVHPLYVKNKLDKYFEGLKITLNHNQNIFSSVVVFARIICTIIINSCWVNNDRNHLKPTLLYNNITLLHK